MMHFESNYPLTTLDSHRKQPNDISHNDFILSQKTTDKLTVDFKYVVDIFIYYPHIQNICICKDEYPLQILNDSIYFKHKNINVLLHAMILYNLCILTCDLFIKFNTLFQQIELYIDSINIEYHKLNKTHKEQCNSHKELLNNLKNKIQNEKLNYSHLTFKPHDNTYLNTIKDESYNISNNIIELFNLSNKDIEEDLKIIEYIYELIHSIPYRFYRVINGNEISYAINQTYTIAFSSLLTMPINSYFETSFIKFARPVQYLHECLLDLIVQRVQNTIIASEHICKTQALYDYLSHKSQLPYPHIRSLYHWYHAISQK